MGVSRCALLLYCMRLCHCYRHDNGAGDAFWIDIYHFYKQKREIFSQNILQSHDKAVPLQPLLKKSFDHCNDSYGRLAQLVQSVCLTSRGSGVRIPQRPPGVSPVVPQGIAGEFVFGLRITVWSNRRQLLAHPAMVSRDGRCVRSKGKPSATPHQ